MSTTDPSDPRPPTPDSSADSSDSSDSRLPTSDSSTRQQRLFPDKRAARFRSLLDSGDYRALFGDQLGALMTQAAAEVGVADELVALRIVMARLLTEEEDPKVLAPLIARIASVSIQAARVQRAINGQLAEGLTDAITTILAELEGGEE